MHLLHAFRVLIPSFLDLGERPSRSWSIVASAAAGLAFHNATIPAESFFAARSMNCFRTSAPRCAPRRMRIPPIETKPPRSGDVWSWRQFRERRRAVHGGARQRRAGAPGDSRPGNPGGFGQYVSTRAPVGNNELDLDPQHQLLRTRSRAGGIGAGDGEARFHPRRGLPFHRWVSEPRRGGGGRGGPQANGVGPPPRLHGRRRAGRRPRGRGAPVSPLTLAALPGVEISAFHLDPSRYPDGDASPAAWHDLLGVKPERKPAFVLLPDPFSSEPQQLIEGLDYAFPNCVKMGGLASGGHSPGMNRLFLDGATHRGGAVGIALSGAISVETAVAQGCRPIGQPGKIGKSHGHYLVEVDGKRALDFIQEQIDQLSEEEGSSRANRFFLGLRWIRSARRPRPGRLSDSQLSRRRPRERRRRRRRDAARRADRPAPRARQADERRRSPHGAETHSGAAARRGPAGALLFLALAADATYTACPTRIANSSSPSSATCRSADSFCNGEIGPVGGETYLHGFTSSFGLFRPAPAGGAA